MIRTQYTKGFEKFWKVWRKVTNKGTDKPEAFKYWKRDKLEGDEEELIRRLNLQQAERKRFKSKGEWLPEWCYCRKWLNNRRYEYVPEPPKKRKEVKLEPLTKEEIERYNPEQVKARAEYRKAVDEMNKRLDAKSVYISTEKLNRRRATNRKTN